MGKIFGEEAVTITVKLCTKDCQPWRPDPTEKDPNPVAPPHDHVPSRKRLSTDVEAGTARIEVPESFLTEDHSAWHPSMRTRYPWYYDEQDERAPVAEIVSS